jgi:hypothetical protein
VPVTVYAHRDVLILPKTLSFIFADGDVSLTKHVVLRLGRELGSVRRIQTPCDNSLRVSVDESLPDRVLLSVTAVRDIQPPTGTVQIFFDQRDNPAELLYEAFR